MESAQSAINTGVNSRIKRQLWPSGFAVDNVYDNLGFLTQMRVASGAANTANTTGALLWQRGANTARGQFAQVTYGNSLITRNQYEAQTGLLQTIQTGANAQDASVINHTYNYNALGHLIGRNDTNHNTQEIFQYDQLNRLNEQMLTTAGGQLRSISTRYNAIGNILSQSDVGYYTYATAAVGNRPHALASINGQAGKLTNPSYSYDLHGNIAAVTSSNGAGRTHTWTSFDNPDALTLRDASGNTASISFLYGPEHQRIREVTSKANAANPSLNSQKTLAVLHPDNEGGLYFERETINTGAGAGSAQNRHYLSAEKGSFLLVTSNGAIQTDAQSSSSLSTPAAIANADYKYWHKDHLGSIVASTNSNLTVIERLAYEPFGKRRFANGAYDQTGTIDATSTNRGFTGHEHLDELDFIHMNGRVFDPDIGRFLSPDPTIPYAHNPQSFNRYAYAMNNPLNRVDLDGFQDAPAQAGSPEENNSTTKSNGSVITDNTDAKGTSLGANNPKGGKDSPTNGLKGQDIPGTVTPTEQPAQSRGALGSFISGLMDLGSKALAATFGGGVARAGVAIGKGVQAAEKGLKAEQALVAAKAAEEVTAALASKTVAKGVTNPSIAKGAIPAVGNMTNKEVGQLVGWGSGPKDAAAAAASVTAKDVAAMQKGGLSKADAVAIQGFYANDFARNANNLTAAHRADLMGKVAEMMK